MRVLGPLVVVLLACDGPSDDESDGDGGHGTDTTTGTASDEGENEDSGTHTDGTGTDACGNPSALEQWPSSGFLIEFEVNDQRAHLWVTATSAVEHVAWWLDHTDESLGIPGGPIELDGTYNPGYSYRLDPEQVTFADFWIEVCDAAPCYIESEGPMAWMLSPGSWCPWGFSALQIWDCRDRSGDPSCPLVWP